MNFAAVEGVGARWRVAARRHASPPKEPSTTADGWYRAREGERVKTKQRVSPRGGRPEIRATCPSRWNHRSHYKGQSLLSVRNCYVKEVSSYFSKDFCALCVLEHHGLGRRGELWGNKAQTVPPRRLSVTTMSHSCPAMRPD